MATDDRPAAEPPAWDDNADEVLVEGMITAAVALVVLALVRMLTCYLWSTSQSDVDDTMSDALPPLPPLAEQPWFKKEPSWFVDRWKLVGKNRRAARPIHFVVHEPGAAAAESEVLHLTLVRHGQGVHNVLADEALGREALQFVGSDCDSAGLPFSPMAFPGFPDFLGTILAKVCPLGSRLGEVCAFGPETRVLNSFSVPHRSVKTVLNRSIICRFI